MQAIETDVDTLPVIYPCGFPTVSFFFGFARSVLPFFRAVIKVFERFLFGRYPDLAVPDKYDIRKSDHGIAVVLRNINVISVSRYAALIAIGAKRLDGALYHFLNFTVHYCSFKPIFSDDPQIFPYVKILLFTISHASG